MSQPTLATRRILRVSFWGKWVAAVACVLLLVSIVMTLWATVGDRLDTRSELIEEFGVGDLTQTLTTSQAFLAGVLYSATDLLGLGAMLTALRLFSGFRRGEVFTRQTARSLRRIGVFVFAIGPVGPLSKTVGTAYIAATLMPSHGRIHISFGDTEVYAILLGLILIAVGYVMVQAVDLSDENRAFI